MSIPAHRPTGPEPRTSRLRAVLPGGSAAALGVNVRHPVRLSRRRSTAHPRATDPRGNLRHPPGPRALGSAAAGPPGPACRDTQGYAGYALRALYCPPTPRVTHSGPCHPQGSGGFAAAASLRALRASGCAAALRARQTSPHRDRRDLRMGYPLSRSQILCSSALQRVACLPGSGCQTDLARTAAAA